MYKNVLADEGEEEDSDRAAVHHPNTQNLLNNGLKVPSLKLILPQLTFTEALFADSAITESEPSTVGIFNAATLSTVDVAAIIKGIDESAKVVHIPSGNKVDEVVVGSLMQFIESSMGEYIRNGQITSADLQKRAAIMLHLSTDVKYVHVRGKIKALCVSKVELEMGEPATYLHELHVVNEPAYQRKGVATAGPNSGFSPC